MGLCSSSFPLAINTYFKVKRTKAFGIAVTIAGLGPIIFPLLVSFLLSRYGASNTCFIVAGLSLHIFIAASLLQPVKYHMKNVTKEVALLEKSVTIPLNTQTEAGAPDQQSRYILLCCKL